MSHTTDFDLLQILSIILGYQNLIENRQQSTHNDVTVANDKQAQFLLEKLSNKFDEQNALLERVLKAVEKWK